MKKVLLLVLGLWSLASVVPVSAQQDGNNELLMSLYTQLEALQREVQTLRGLVEEQSYQIQRIDTEQRDRYLDIDRRLSGAAQGSALGQAPGVTPYVPPVAGNEAPATGTPGAFDSTVPPGVRNTPAPTDSGAAPAPSIAGNASVQGVDASQLNEQDLYSTALNLLLEQSQYEESIRLFQSYIDRYPQGRLLTNALYWQGEALILVSRFPEAQAVFSKILAEYPQHAKAAGAMLKLGVVYRQLGDEARAMQTWREIATRYPENATEIREAQNYLNRR